MITQQFILDSKIALEIQKTRVAIATRIFSHLTESYIRGSVDYGKLLALRKDKNVDRKDTAKLTKKLLVAQLKTSGLSEAEFTEVFVQTKKANVSYMMLVQAEKEAFKTLVPQLKEIPVYGWMLDVKGLGVRFAVKLISNIRDINRFENPSKLRKYCGCVPDQKMKRGQEANFNPELKGILLGQVSESFIKSVSQYKRVYDEKKAYYLGLHPEALAEKSKDKKLTKEDWTKMKIHNYAKKTMINRFLVDLWMAWYMSEGKVPPKNPWIVDQPHHTLEPMVVPYSPKPKNEKEQ